MITLHPILGYTTKAETIKEWELGYSFVAKGNTPFSGSIINKSDAKMLKEYGQDRVALVFEFNTLLDGRVITDTVEVAL